MATRIGIFVFDGAEELDWAGPWEVLAAWAQRYPEDDTEVFTVSRTAGEITCAKGLRVLADYTWNTAPMMNVLIYPGGRGTREHVGDPAIHAWLEERASEADIVTSVCTGALVLADAGLLDGRPATTHWESLDTLAGLGKNIEVRPGDRFVDSGGIITAAGVSAGIDMALHLIVRLAGEDRAREVRRYIQYDPEPPV